MTDRRSTTIQRLRLRTAPGGESPSHAVVLRLRASAWLGMADLRPPGLPPAAILHVRRLPDPLPHGANPAASFRPPPAWQQALRSAMRDALREAKPPVNGRVPASAAAVVFANPAEQMACLAADLAHGRASRCWWWRPLLKRVQSGAVAPGTQIARALTDPPADTPTAIAYLAKWSELGAVLPALSAPEAEAVLRAWAPHHGLTLPAGSLSPVRQEPRLSPEPDTQGTDAPPPWSQATERVIPRGWSRAHRALVGLAFEQVRAPHRTDLRSRTAATWWTESEWTGSESTGADIAATDRHATRSRRRDDRPDAAPSTPSGPSAREGMGSPSSEPTSDSALSQPTEREAPVVVPGTRRPKMDSASDKHTDSTEHPSPERPRRAPDSPSVRDIANPVESPARPSRKMGQTEADSGHATDEVTADSVSPGKGGEARSSTLSADDLVPNDGPTANPPEASSSDLDNKSSNESSASASPELDAPASTTIETWAPNLDTQVFGSQLGGTFYLVNLLDALGLTGFEEDRSPPFATRVQGEASPWAMLEAVTRALLTDALEAPSSADPFPVEMGNGDPWHDDLWTAFAHLDGRSPDTPVGANLLEVSAFVAPAAALAQVEPPDVVLRWQVRAGRLWVGSRQCFWADVPAPKYPEEAAEALLAHVHGEAGTFPGATFRRIPPSDPAPRSFPDRSDAAVPHVSPALSQWTRRVLPLVTTRLRQALDGSLDPSAPGDLASLLAIPATLHIEPMHLDVTFPLNAISLPVRMAGLDRSPGWMPTFGKVVNLHFEGKS